jgi:amino-acid N-acetyltransferase
VTVRLATVADVPAIHALVRHFATQGRMILRHLDELYATLRELHVCDIDGQVVGCAASHLFWSDLAELKCLAVREDFHGRGIGRAICLACQDDLRRLGVRQMFTLTTATGFFERLGYRRVAKESLPRFIWGECVRCPSFPECPEDALLLDLLP